MSGETKHTPGPWSVEAMRRPVKGGGERVYWQVLSGDKVVTEVDGFIFEPKLEHLPPAETEANARLIAAAPALLEALRLALAFMSAELDEGHAAIRSARAALALVHGTNTVGTAKAVK